MSKARIAIAWLVTTALLAGAGITTAVMASAAVTLYTAIAEVRVRTGPSTSKTILHLLKKGDVVEGKGKAKDGWQPVSFNNATGYVYAQHVKVIKSTKTPITNAAPSTRKTSANVNLRDAANLDSTIIRVLKKGSAVAATGRRAGDFTEVKVDGKIRWLFTKYVGATTTAKPHGPAKPADPTEPETPAAPTDPELPDAVAVMDPFHVIRLAGEALDRCRRRVQQDLHGHRGRTGDPLYAARRTLHTGDGLLTDKQKDRLQALFRVEEHVEVEATWGIYQRMIAAYREPDRARGRQLMHGVIESLSSGVPAALTELITLGRTLKKRAADVLAYFERPGTSNGPTEAINGRLEHLRGSALGFRNLANYIARSLLEAGGFRPRLHPGL